MLHLLKCPFSAAVRSVKRLSIPATEQEMDLAFAQLTHFHILEQLLGGGGQCRELAL